MSAQNGRVDATRKPSRRIVATYGYHAADERVPYRVVRFEPKGFIPQHPTEAGAWSNGFASDERVPYNLPRLLAEPSRVVFWCEGEKDCDRLASLGLLATTTAGGAKSYRKHAATYAEHFRGRPRVAVIPDNDQDGRDYVAAVSESLVAVGVDVRMIELPVPVAGDVSDWLDAGHTVEELPALVKAAQRWEPPAMPHANTVPGHPGDHGDDPMQADTRARLRLVPASTVKPERVTWAWDQRVPVGMASLLVGQGGLGKSLELCWLAAGWSRGTVPGDLHGTPVDVAIASAEDHRQAVILPRLLAAGADLSRIHFLEQINPDGEADDIAINGEIAVLEQTLVAGNVRVLLVDTVIAHIPAQHDTYNEQRVRAVLKPLKAMAERNGQVVLGVMHLNRREARDVLTRISGSGGFGNLARSVLLFARDPDEPDGPTRILAIGKSNVGGMAATLKLALEPCLVPDDDDGEIPTVRLVDSGTSTYTSSQLLAVPADDEERDAGAEAERFLSELLADGPVDAQTVKRTARENGIAEKTLWRAAKRLGVKTNDRAGFGPGYPSRWSLLGHDNPYSAIKNSGPVGEGWPSRESEVVRATPRTAPPGEAVRAVLATFPGSKLIAHHFTGGVVAWESPRASITVAHNTLGHGGRPND